jgi:hypothetical protein
MWHRPSGRCFAADTGQKPGATTIDLMPALDDRGNPITVLKPADIRRAGDSDDAARSHLAVHLRQAIKAESRRFSWFHVAWSMGAILVWIAVQVLASSIGLHRYPGVRPLIFFGSIAVLVLIAREVTRRRVSRLVAATAVAEGICGQCCYSLESVPTDADGRMTCPECGAAWLRERITRPFWLAPQLPQTFHDERLPLLQRLTRAYFLFITVTPKPSTIIATDDRGRFVRTVDSRLWLAPSSRRAELGKARIAKLRRGTRRRGRIPRVIVSLPALAMLGLTLWLLSDLEPYNSRPLAPLLILGALVSLAAAIAINFSHSFLPPTHTAHVLAADSLCGSCLATLEGIPADPDGCVTCRRCGAAWRHAPQTQP